eukprot:4671274-Amphidinium_carterae.1
MDRASKAPWSRSKAMPFTTLTITPLDGHQVQAIDTLIYVGAAYSTLDVTRILKFVIRKATAEMCKFELFWRESNVSVFWKVTVKLFPN